MNIIWENKGIVLGIISYLIENHALFKNNIIVIRNTKFNNVISNLFPDMKIVHNGDGFHINIKNQNKNGLIINNLQNLSIVHASNVKFLPWFDIDNPIIMYLYDKKKVYDKDLLADDIYQFNENTRFKAIRSNDPQYQEFINQHCGINIWDTQFEFNILSSYIKYYPGNLFEINQFIDNQLGGLRCEKPIQIPILIPINVPVGTSPDWKNKGRPTAKPVGISKDVNKISQTTPKKEFIQASSKITMKESCDHSNFDMSITIITNIIRRINEILESGLAVR